MVNSKNLLLIVDTERYTGIPSSVSPTQVPTYSIRAIRSLGSPTNVPIVGDFVVLRIGGNWNRSPNFFHNFGVYHLNA
jgi:hypothetical protein